MVTCHWSFVTGHSSFASLCRFIENFDNVFHFRLAVVVPDAVSQHGDAKGTGGGHLVGTGRNDFLGPLVVDAFADGLFHKHPGTAGPAAQALICIAIHFSKTLTVAYH